jgi:hypothetical protein
MQNKHCVLDCCQPRNLCLFAVTSPGHIVQMSAIWICIRPFASPMEEVVLTWVLLVWRSTLLDYGHPILCCVTSFSVFSIRPCLSILHVCVADLHHFKAWTCPGWHIYLTSVCCLVCWNLEPYYWMMCTISTLLAYDACRFQQEAFQHQRMLSLLVLYLQLLGVQHWYCQSCSFIYISMMGSQDLTDALRISILNANYMAKHFEVSCHCQMNLDLVWSRVRVGHPSCPIPWATGKLLPRRWLFVSYGNKKVEPWQYVWFCDRIITQYCSVVWMEHVHMSSSLTCKHSRFFAIQMCACID